MTKEYKIDITQDENGIFIWEIKNLPACYTQWSTISELMERMVEVSQWSIELLNSIKNNQYRSFNISMMVDYA
jgi:predicted RNase H-like HicB family nuclease